MMRHVSPEHAGRRAATAAAPVPQGCPFTLSHATRPGGLDRGDRDAHPLPHLPRSVTAGARMAVPGGEVPRHAWKRILQVHVTLERGRASAHSSGTAAPCPGSRGKSAGDSATGHREPAGGPALSGSRKRPASSRHRKAGAFSRPREQRRQGRNGSCGPRSQGSLTGRVQKPERKMFAHPSWQNTPQKRQFPNQTGLTQEAFIKN